MRSEERVGGGARLRVTDATGVAPLEGWLCGAHSAENRSANSLGNRVIPAVGVALAAVALLLDVVHDAIGRQLAITADYAAAGERGEAEESNKVTHRFLSVCALSNNHAC